MQKYRKCSKVVKVSRKRYTKENIEFLREKAKIKNITEKELTQMYNERFDDNRSEASLKYIRTKNGTERVRKGYVEVKVKQPNVWDQKHRYLWEKHHKKKLKHNEIVIFADKDNRNFNVDNLIMIPRKYLAILNYNQWISENPELTKSGVKLAKLLKKIHDKEQEAK